MHSHKKGAPPKVILDLSRYSDKSVIVRMAGGRQVRGTLKGWDPLLNLVLDDACEYLRGKSHTSSLHTSLSAYFLSTSLTPQHPCVRVA